MKIIIVILLVLLFCCLFTYWNKSSTNKDMHYIRDLLAQCDVQVIHENDNEATRRDGDVIYSDESFFDDVIANASLGAGESYMKGKWYAHNDKLDTLFYKLLINNIEQKITSQSWSNWIWLISTRFSNHQSRKSAYDVEDVHYNIDNELYRQMLGPSMAYSCGYFDVKKNPTNNLDVAQYAKFQLLCDKLQLQPGDHVLDIGCGFGSLDRYIVENYDCKVTGVNISKEQLKYANEIRKDLGENIKSRLVYLDMDYRDVKGTYSKVVSVGMFEHVGHKNYREYFEKAYSCLADGGIFVLHTIGGNSCKTSTDPWINKYIFPNGVCPSIKQIGGEVAELFVIEDLQNFGPDYDKTLQAWYNNYKLALQSNKIKKDVIFNRMWEYYLLSCAATFRARKNQLWQFVLTKNRIGKYTAPR